MRLKMPSGKWRPYCLGLNVLTADFIHITLDYYMGSRKTPGLSYDGPSGSRIMTQNMCKYIPAENDGIITLKESAKNMCLSHDDVIQRKQNFRITGPLLGESTGHRWIPFTKASDVELWWFLWCEQKFEQTVQMTVIWNAIALIVTSL